MNDETKGQVPVFVSLLTYFGMSLGAMVLIVGPKILAHPSALGLCFLFPFGVGFLIGPSSRVIGHTFVIVSYVSFLIFFVSFKRARSWATYGMLCIGFALLLLLNVAGCRKALQSLENITMMPNKSLLATRDGAGSSAIADYVISPACLSSGR